MNLPKRSEIKANYRPQLSESIPEEELYHALLCKGLRFEKQYPIGPFFADLSHPKYKIAVEYDGAIHQGKEEADASRHDYIRKLGWTIFRIKNEGMKSIYCNERFLGAWNIDYIEICKIAAQKIKDYLEDNFLDDFYFKKLRALHDPQRDFISVNESLGEWYDRFQDNVDGLK